MGLTWCEACQVLEGKTIESEEPGEENVTVCGYCLEEISLLREYDERMER